MSKPVNPPQDLASPEAAYVTGQVIHMNGGTIVNG
jgi:NAD(P)-dependent dehydrogenase (short-subunit alcohol dehydrogenase family)